MVKNNGRHRWAVHFRILEKKTFFWLENKAFFFLSVAEANECHDYRHEDTLNNGTLLNDIQNKDTQGSNTQLNGT
jgi:hypothetical protein